VRASALDALVLLLDKGGMLLKAFVPQLQTSLVKNLNDAHEPARTTALRALKRLLRLSTRVDPLVRELCTCLQGIAVAEDGPQQTLVRALRLVMEEATDKLSDKKLDGVLQVLHDLRHDLADSARHGGSGGGDNGGDVPGAAALCNVAFAQGALAASAASCDTVDAATLAAARQLAAAVSADDSFEAYGAACQLQGTLQVLTVRALASDTLAAVVDAAKRALRNGSPPVAAKAATVLIGCAHHAIRHAAGAGVGAGAGASLTEVVAVVEPAFHADQTRELQRQVLASLRVLALRLDNSKLQLLDAASRDSAVRFLGACAAQAKRKSDAHRARKVLGIFLRRHRLAADKDGLWASGFASGSAAARAIVADAAAAEQQEGSSGAFEYDTDDDEFSWA
jgi:hypothetical protein